MKCNQHVPGRKVRMPLEVVFGVGDINSSSYKMTFKRGNPTKLQVWELFWNVANSHPVNLLNTSAQQSSDGVGARWEGWWLTQQAANLNERLTRFPRHVKLLFIDQSLYFGKNQESNCVADSGCGYAAFLSWVLLLAYKPTYILSCIRDSYVKMCKQRNRRQQTNHVF